MLTRVAHDFWPIDQGVAANILASFVCFVFATNATYLIWPHARRVANAWVRGHLHEHRKAMDVHLSELHRKVDHLIRHHPDIPDLPEKED
jgi:hypothetical protein